MVRSQSQAVRKPKLKACCADTTVDAARQPYPNLHGVRESHHLTQWLRTGVQTNQPIFGGRVTEFLIEALISSGNAAWCQQTCRFQLPIPHQQATSLLLEALKRLARNPIPNLTL